MKKYKELLNIINHVINGKELQEDIDWKSCYVLAKGHNLLSIFNYAVKDAENVDAEVRNKAELKYLSAVNQQIKQDYYAQAIGDELKSRGIKFMFLKGYYMRRLYPSPDMRLSADLDIFYDKNKRNEVAEMMANLGFLRDSEGDVHDVYKSDVVTVEMHHVIIRNLRGFAEYYNNLWERLKIGDVTEYKFTDEDFYIFFMIHLMKHFFNGGNGIRTILDIYIYNKAKPDLNKNYISGEFKKLKMSRFSKMIEKLSQVWFGDGKTDVDTEVIGDYIAESGAYGKTDNNIIMNYNGNPNAENVKMKYFINKNFIPFKDMKKNFPVLNKAPFLLPAFWIYRILRVLFTARRKKIKDFVNVSKKINKESCEKINRIKKISGITEDSLDD